MPDQHPAIGPDGPVTAEVPPTVPWWSRPGTEPWGAPAQGAPAQGAPAQGAPAQGAPAQGAAPPAGQPPYGEGPTSYGTPPPFSAPPPPPAGGSPWAGPPDSLGREPRSPRRTARALALGGAILATALVSGVTGGLVVQRQQQQSNLYDPAASLGTGGSTPASIDRPPTSVAGIAARVLRSTVSVSVQAAGSSGTGSGVILSRDGYVLTNNHVVQAAAGGGSISVSFNGSDGTERPASIVGRDPETDLAVLKVSGGGTFAPATLGQSRSLVVGDPVIAIGSPLGLAGTVTTGIVSALNRTVQVPGENGASSIPLFNAIQTDASINPGNSGGALVDDKGQVIGINSAIATLGGGGGGTQSGSIGVGFAIPVDEARSVAEELIRTGKATHPAVGVEAQTVPTAGSRGARVVRVLPGGPADKAGLQPGDLIVKVGDTPVTSVDELIVAIRQHRIGEKVPVTYRRNGGERMSDITLQQKSSG